MTWTSWRKTARGAVKAGMCAYALTIGAPAMASEASSSAVEATGATSAAKGQLTIRFEGLRSNKGLMRVCMTRNKAHFPKCEDDPVAFKASVAAGKDAHILFSNVPPGDYALMVMHDENSNAKLDTMLGIPREGVGFSRNPRLRFGAPSYDAVVFTVPVGDSSTVVKLQYFL